MTVKATGPNTDGCDPDACHNVWIKDCSFSDGDDCIAIKSGRDQDGHRVGLPSENLVIQNCKFQAGHGGVTCGSETAGGIHNVYAENCEFNSPDLEMALRFKTNPARGGSIDHVYIRNCAIKTAKYGIHMTLRYSSAGALEGEYTPEIKDIDIRNCTFANLTKQPIFIEGYSDAINDLRRDGRQLHLRAGGHPRHDHHQRGGHPLDRKPRRRAGLSEQKNSQQSQNTA